MVRWRPWRRLTAAPHRWRDATLPPQCSRRRRAHWRLPSLPSASWRIGGSVRQLKAGHLRRRWGLPCASTWRTHIAPCGAMWHVGGSVPAHRTHLRAFTPCGGLLAALAVHKVRAQALPTTFPSTKRSRSTCAARTRSPATDRARRTCRGPAPDIARADTPARSRQSARR
jgi:hypothetical protein